MLVALSVNAAIGVLKLVAGIFTGSAAMFAEAAHSGVLLSGVAYILGHTNKGLLIGRQADPRLVYAVRDRLAARPEIEQVVDLLTMMVGTDRVLVCARLDFVDALGAADVELACVDIDERLRAEFPDLDEIVLEPVPRTDPGIRARVLERYGPDPG